MLVLERKQKINYDIFFFLTITQIINVICLFLVVGILLVTLEVSHHHTLSSIIHPGLSDVDAVVSFESFRALKRTLFESFRVLKSFRAIQITLFENIRVLKVFALFLRI